MPFFTGDTPQEFRIRLRRIYVLYTAGFALMILLMALVVVYVRLSEKGEKR